MLARVAYRWIDSSGHTSSRGTSQHFPAHRFPHGKLDSCPAAGVWIHCHVCSANGNTGLQYPIAHTDGDHPDIGGNGNAC